MNLTGFSRAQRLVLVGARIAELETRTPDAIEWDKLRVAERMLWLLIEAPDDPTTEDAWERYCKTEKPAKYIKYLGAL